MKNRDVFFLTFIALPLSFVGIPIYLNIADFYARKFAINLATIGLLLLVVRIFDFLQDPFIGALSDRLSNGKISRRKIIRIAAIFLVIGFFLLFNPPYFLNEIAASVWFFVTLFFTYLSFNFISINFESAVARIANNDSERVKLNSVKEFFGLIGMILAFLLPGIFQQFFVEFHHLSHLFLALIFALLLGFGVVFFKAENVAKNISKPKFSLIFKDVNFRYFALIILLNSLAVSLPAANMNFYVRDVLQANKILPWSLSIYFLSACFFLVFWKKFFARFGIIPVWKFAIFGSILTFSGAYFLDNSSANFFYLICLFSGIFLGADLIAVPAILAKITNKKIELTSSYFSLLSLLSKIGLTIAASGSLIFLGYFGYNPNNVLPQNLWAISFFYAALPCFFKLIVIALIHKFQKYEN